MVDRFFPAAETVMLAYLFLSATLSLGQPPPTSAPTTPAPAAAPPPPAPATPATPAPDRWLLMKELQGTWEGDLLDSNRLQISGWTDASYTASSDRVSNLPMGFNYRANQFLLQQNWLRVERLVVPSASEPTFGFRSDWILPGSDYVFTLPRGIFNEQLSANDGKPNRYGIDPIQFYAEAYFPSVGKGMDVKVGRFFSQYGVESTPAVDNFLLSHSYTDLYDPFTHTGVLTTTNLTDVWSVQVGASMGCDNFFGPTATPTFLGSVKWAPPTGNDSVLFCVIVGSGRFNQNQNFANPEVFDVVWMHKLSSRLTGYYESLFGFMTNVPDKGTVNWYSAIGYLNYACSPRLGATIRLENFVDAQGERTHFEGDYSALTTGLQFRLRKAIILRPELRYDYNPTSRPFEDHHGLFTAASDIIIRW
jgi:hypothetical protein